MRVFAWNQRTAKTSVVALAFVACAVGCGGGGGSSPAVPSIAAPSTTPALPPVASGSTVATPQGPAGISFSPIAGGLHGSLTAPAASNVATLSATLQATLPSVFPQVQSVRRLPATVGTNAFQTIGFVTIAPSVTVTFPTSLSFTFVSPVPLSANAIAYVAEFDPSNSAAGWTTILGPGTIIAGSTITFEATPAQLTLAGGMTYGFVLLVATQTLASPTPSPTLSPQPTSSPSPTPSPQPALSPAPTPTPSPSPTATPSPQPTPTPSPQPMPTPTSAPLGSPSVSPATANIVSTSVPVTVTVTEPGYTGSFVVNGARCAGVATIAAAGKAVGQYTVTGVAAGSCTITFTDTFLQAVVLPVVVTTTTATITIG